MRERAERNKVSQRRECTIFGGEFEFSPGLLLAMWASGTAAGAALVARWRIVGPGYTWLTAATVVMIGGGTLFFDGTWPAWFGVATAALAIATARRPLVTAALLAGSSMAFLLEAMSSGYPILAVTGSAALGGITAEMLLGHWYLVSPQMPRWALQTLDVGGAAGMAADAVLLVLVGALAGVGTASTAAFVALAGMSVLLMVAVWFSLKEPSYPGVMAATGLSYLAVLTSLGATALGRTLLAGSGAFFLFE